MSYAKGHNTVKYNYYMERIRKHNGLTTCNRALSPWSNATNKKVTVTKLLHYYEFVESTNLIRLSNEIVDFNVRGITSHNLKLPQTNHDVMQPNV